MTVIRPRSLTRLLVFIFANFLAYMITGWLTRRGQRETIQDMWKIQEDQIKKAQELLQELLAEQTTIEDNIDQVYQSSFEAASAFSDILLPRPSAPAPRHSFKVPEGLAKTHDVAIPRDIPPWTERETALLGTSLGFNVMTEMIKDIYYGNGHLEEEEKYHIDLAKMSRTEHVYKALRAYLAPTYHALVGTTEEKNLQFVALAQTRPEVDFFFKLEQELFGFLKFKNHSTTFSLQESFAGKGIVICAGNNQLAYAATTIVVLRQVLKTTLPIQVFYNSQFDLDPIAQQYLGNITTDLEFVDVTEVLDHFQLLLEGWAIKPFALLASRFEEAILIDADAFFVRNPEELFEDPGYQATGTLFFYDRTFATNWHEIPDFMRSIMPFMSTFPEKTRAFLAYNTYEQESGAVLVNKKTRLLGLLAASRLNARWERKLWSYKAFYGDKETYWIGFEMVQEPYAFMRTSAGVIGEVSTKENATVCGCQVHLDHQDRLLWWNGGLFKNKNSNDRRLLNFEYWMHGGGHQEHRELFVRRPELVQELLKERGVSSLSELEIEPEDPKWNIGESCLSGGTIQELDPAIKAMAATFKRLYEVTQSDQMQLQIGQPMRMEHDWEAIVEDRVESANELPLKHNWEAFFHHAQAHASNKGK
ncbi:hypothetical protein BGZ94_007630 [Podila epigama]|nr:hypothetical protein BGZ94_007630 [Podila epigama]